jgi:hypothetical protein
MDRRRTITLSVRDDFSGKLKRFTQDMDQAAQSTEKIGRTGSINLRDFNQQLFYAAQNAQVVYGAFQRVFSTASQWAQMGAQAERSAYALRVYAGSAEEADRWMQAILTSMRGTVTEGEAAAQAYMLMKFGLADSAEAAGEFARTLSVVAAANPQLGGTENALMQIQLTLANMSFMRLDQLGLSAGQVKERMEELQGAMPGLSREAAFQQAVMEGLKEQADKLGEGMANVTIEQDRLRAKVRGFKEDIGREINEGFEGASVAVLGLLDILEKLTEKPWYVVVNLSSQILGGGVPSEEDVQGITNYLGFMLNYGMAKAAQGLGLATEDDVRQAAIDYLRSAGIAGRTSVMTPSGTAAPLDPGLWGGAWTGQRILGGGTPLPASRPTSFADQLAIAIARRDRELAMQAYEFKRFQSLAAGIPQAQYAHLPFGERLGIQMGQLPMPMRVTPESGGIWGRMLTVGAERAEERAEKTAGSLERITEAASKLKIEAQKAATSLEELMGIAPTVFDASVYQAGVEALRDYGVDSKKAEEATRYLAIMTGEVNAESEIFRLRMQGAAEQLERGTLSAEGYAIQVGLLAQEIQRGDWDWVGRLLGTPTDEEGLRRYVELIERLASGEISLEDVTKVTDTVAEGVGRIKEFFFGKEAEVDPLQNVKDSYDDLALRSKQRWSEMQGDMMAWVDLSTGQVRGWKEAFVHEIDTVETRLGAMTSRSWTVSITSTFSEETRGGRMVPTEFQHGGYTGDGPAWEVAGIVHRGEYVLSQDMLRKMRQGQRAPDYPRLGPMVGGGGGGITITGPIHVHGVQNAAQLLDALEREAGRRNKRLVGAMA